MKIMEHTISYMRRAANGWDYFYMVKCEDSSNKWKYSMRLFWDDEEINPSTKSFNYF